MVLIATVVMVFLTALFLSLGLVQWSLRPTALKDKLAGFAFRVPVEDEQPARRFTFLRTFGRLVPRTYLARKEVSLKDADIQLFAAEFVGVQVVVFLGAGAVFALINVWFGLIAGFLAALSLDLLVEAKKRVRQALIDEQLIEALSIMTGAVRAGYSLQQAMKMVIEEMDDPIRTVFSRFMDDMSMGVVMEEALENMARQTHNADVELMTIAIRINRQIGGNISEILGLIQNTVIDRIKLKKNIKTLTAQGRLSGAIISGLPVAVGLLIYLMEPSYIGVLFHNALGLTILVGSGLMMIMGILVMRRILDMKV
ncbi:MAG TPA: type II secretion system F family protein [Spirochaetia bacterium]|nr:type II secretion system F family protein [Spirochaetia bacterium]